VELTSFQARMATLYGERDRARDTAASVAWLVEEVGELAQAVRKGDGEQQLHELGDVLAWLASLADQLGLSLDDAAARYATGCPRSLCHYCFLSPSRWVSLFDSCGAATGTRTAGASFRISGRLHARHRRAA
jgi:NTP pyrophosphatase (non-canonical NTP hydrolase)